MSNGAYHEALEIHGQLRDNYLQLRKLIERYYMEVGWPLRNTQRQTRLLFHLARRIFVRLHREATSSAAAAAARVLLADRVMIIPGRLDKEQA